MVKPGELHRKSWIFFLLGCGMMCVLIFLPFIIQVPQTVWFGMLKYHTLRSVDEFPTFYLYKLGFISRFIQAYFVLILVGLGLVIIPVCFKDKWIQVFANVKHSKFWRLLLGSFLTLTVVHGMAPMPYDDYQVWVVPLLSVVCVSMLVHVVDLTSTSEHQCTRLLNVGLCFILFLTILGSFSSPRNQAWFILGRDRIWWKKKPVSPIAQLQHAAKVVRESVGTNDEIITQDTYLAVEAGVQVPRGMEMGPFCYFPDFTTSKAKQLHVLNKELMMDLLQGTQAPFVALSGYGFAISSPTITEVKNDEQLYFRKLLGKKYTLIKEIPHFGQAHTSLQLFKKVDNISSPTL